MKNKYKVIRDYLYQDEIEVEADSVSEAMELSSQQEPNEQFHCYYDAYAEIIEENN